MRHYILLIPGNGDVFISRPIREITKDIDALYWLIYTVAHIVVKKDVNHNTKEEADEDAMIDGFMSPIQDPL